MTSVNVQLLLTGDELMVGDIVDSNSSMIAQELRSLGVNITRKVGVADVLDHLVEEISHISKRADILIVNGGLGPTVDDLTAQALAKVLGVELYQHPDALAHITHWCESKGVKLNEPNLKQAYLPKGCEIIANKHGSAVGFKAVVNQCNIFCTPGVPSELKQMLVDEIKPQVSLLIPQSQHYHVNRFQVFGIGESSLQKMFNEQCPDWPKEIEIGFRASMPILEVKLTTKSNYAATQKEQWIKRLHQMLGDHIIAEIDHKPHTFAHHLQALLIQNNETITTAESCTGGLIASSITSEPGSSQIFHAGFVTYANTIKESVLGVKEATLEQHGAVSEETVREMALGALDKSNADYVIATSGVAGPAGGTDEKPVGTVWIAWGKKQNLKTTCLFLPVTRHYFQHYVCAIGLDLIRRMLIGSNQTPLYIKDRTKNKEN